MATTLDTYAPFDAGAGGSVTEATWRSFMRHMRGSLWGDGVLRTATTGFELFGDSSGMQVKVRAGECWIRGAWGQSTAEKTLAIAAAHATLARKDRGIIRNDFVNNRIELDILTGTPHASPTLPSLTQNTSQWEIGLGAIDVPAADTSIGAAQVTDGRLWIDDDGHTVVKSSDKTMNNNNTLSSDTQLVAHMSPNATYKVESCLIYSASTVADARLAMIGPTGATAQITAGGLVFGTSGISADIELGIFAIGTTLAVGGAGTGSKVCARMAGTVVTAEAGGPLTVQFAQNTAEVSNAVLYTGSWVDLKRLS